VVPVVLRVRNLGGIDPGPYPLLPKCEECGHVMPQHPEAKRLHPSHWPWCSKATARQMRLWQRRGELRAQRTIERLP